MEYDKQKLEAKFNAELSKLESNYKSDIESLKNKFRYIEYETKKTKTVSPKETKATRKRIDVAKLKEMLEQKKSVREIAETFGTTQNSIRSKLYQLNIKLSDLK